MWTRREPKSPKTPVREKPEGDSLLWSPSTASPFTTYRSRRSSSSAYSHRTGASAAYNEAVATGKPLERAVFHPHSEDNVAPDVVLRFEQAAKEEREEHFTGQEMSVISANFFNLVTDDSEIKFDDEGSQ